MFGRQRLAVHRPGNKDVGLPRLVHGDRDPEQCFLAFDVHLVRAGERHEQVGRIRRTDGIQYVGQSYAGPFRIADRAHVPGSPDVLATCWRSVRRLPAHWRTAVTVRVANALFSSSTEKERLAMPVPLTSIR